MLKADGVANLLSDKVVFKGKMVTNGNKGHYMPTKGTLQVLTVTIVNIFAQMLERKNP